MSPLDSRIEKLRASPKVRYGGKVLLDALLAVLAWKLAMLVNAAPGRLPWNGVFWGLLAAGISITLRLPRQSYRAIGFRDLLLLMYGGALCLTLGGLLHLALRGLFPTPDVWVLASFLTMFLWAALRSLVRGLTELRSRRVVNPDARRTLVVGAGRAGVMVAEELQHHPELGYHLVGFVDDDLSKQSLWIHGIPVLGPQELLPLLLKQERIERVILAIPSASGRDIRRLAERLQPLGIPLKTVPGIYTLLGTPDWRPVLRDISIEDLLRREPVTLDMEGLQGALEDQVVLITGAGGSIGSELCRQVCRFHPNRLVLLGRGEHSLWLIERELRRTFPGQSLAVELCDVRNRWRLEQAFARWKPAVVIHAAAHKHVPFLELHPEEAVDNNIFGTRNVVETAIYHRAAHFVNISTDKAVNPTNVLGVSKRIAEYLVLEAARHVPAAAHYVSVRFGNVLGSRGSVVPIFQEQIRLGGPLTLTHPDMTRYFMTIPEAAQLVLQAGLLGESGKVYVLDMGEPVKIADLARDMIRLSGLQPDQDIEILYTGPRPGEKLFEELFYGQSQTPSPVHPKVYEAKSESYATLPLPAGLEHLRQALLSPSPERFPALLTAFQALVPNYQPAGNGFAKNVASKGSK